MIRPSRAGAAKPRQMKGAIDMKELTKEQAVKKILRYVVDFGNGGLPEAVRIYNKLSANGFYSLTSKEIKEYFE